MVKVNGNVNLFLMPQGLDVTHMKVSTNMIRSTVLVSFNGKVVILTLVITIWMNEMVLEL